MADPVSDRIGRIRIKSVQVVLSKKSVVTGDPSSGLWPRVTLELDGRGQTFPFTYYATRGQTKEMERPRFPRTWNPARITDYAKVGAAVLRMAGAASGSQLYWSKRSKLSSDQKHSVTSVTQQVLAKIRRAVSAASKRPQVRQRMDRARRSDRRCYLLKELRGRFHDLIFGRGVKHGELRGREIGALWDQVMGEEVARHVHST